MKEQVKKTAADAEKINEKVARLEEELARAKQEAAITEEQHELSDEKLVNRYETREMPDAPGLHPGINIDNPSLESYVIQLTRDFRRILEVLDNVALSPEERRRLQGSGVRRLGFIEKVTDTAEERPEFIPPLFSLGDMQHMARSIELLRTLRDIANAIVRVARDGLLVIGDNSYSQALLYYRSVQEAARRNVPGARDLFTTLEIFFKRGRQSDEEPTEEETIRDVKALLHGQKEGEIIVKGHAKHTVAGGHEVIDDVHKPQNADFKEVTHGTICTECNANNPEHAKFCVNCGKMLVTV